MTAVRRRARRDDGWMSLELVGMAFLLLLMVLFVIQVAAVTYTMAQANGAARAAARASTLGQSGQSAARNAVSSSLHPVATGARGHWTVRLTVPRVVPRMPTMTIVRSATMPQTEPGIGG
ncbi:TadE/TadG family type IV pilus assembly protein [Angustibacter aerolatus]